MAHYKAVLNDGGVLRSIWANGSFAVQYVPNVSVKPSVGKAFVFASLDRAVAFVGSPAGNLEVWECEVRGEEEVESVLPFYCLYNDTNDMKEMVHAFWESDVQKLGDPAREITSFVSYQRNATVRLPLMRPPEGTVMVDEVSLLRKIQ